MYFEKPSQNRYPCEVLNNINEPEHKLNICIESSLFLERVCTNSFYTLHVSNWKALFPDFCTKIVPLFTSALHQPLLVTAAMNLLLSIPVDSGLSLFYWLSQQHLRRKLKYSLLQSSFSSVICIEHHFFSLFELTCTVQILI